MPVVLTRGVVSRARRSESVLLRLTADGKPEQMREVMVSAAAAIRADGGDNVKYVSEPVETPSGWMLMVDRASTRPRSAGREPELLKAAAENLGVRTGTVEVPEPIADRWDEATWPAAKAVLRGVLQQPFGPAPRGVDENLVTGSLKWLRSRWIPGRPLVGLVSGTPVGVGWGSAQGFLSTVLSAGWPVSLLADDPEQQEYADHAPPMVNLGPNTAPAAAWTEARLTADGLAEAMRAQRDHARAMSGGLAWAGVTCHDQER